MHAAMHGAGASLRSQVLSSSPSELEERLSFVLKGEAVIVHGKDAADNLPFGRGKRPQVKEPLSIVFAPDTHASQKVSPSGIIIIASSLVGIALLRPPPPQGGPSRCVQIGWTVSQQFYVQ